MFAEIISFIRKIYSKSDFIPLHEPHFGGNEKKYVMDAIESSYVSSIGEYVNRFEDMIKNYTNSLNAISTVNGTSALHISLLLAGVRANDEVITQPVSFIATSNAIKYCGAEPIFIDVDKDTLGMSPEKLEEFLHSNTITKDDGQCYNKVTDKIIKACLPVHTFGHPTKIDQIIEICRKNNIIVIEDAAESLGSKYKNEHTGNFGKFGIFSFNGNKIMTCGGGGMIITADDYLAKKAKHLTTTAKVDHKWEYVHDSVGYNYRLTNLNAAFACAQMENLDTFIKNKRELTKLYSEFFERFEEVDFVVEPTNCYSNYWLNTILFENRNKRDEFLEYSNNRRVMTRPLWQLINTQDMYTNCQKFNLDNSKWLEDRVVNIPSSVRL